MASRGTVFDCNAAYGHFKVQRRAITASSILVTGSLSFEYVWFPGEWFPAATISVRGDDARPEVAAISLLQPPHRHEVMVAQETYYEPPKGLQHASFQDLYFGMGSDVLFALRLTPNHLEARVGQGEWSTVPLTFTPHEVVLSCSSAEVIFHDLNVTEPAPP